MNDKEEAALLHVWNRTVLVKSGSTTLASYGFDALGQRIFETSPGTTRDHYFSSDWQVLEERVAGTPKTQYVWSPVYVDALIERDRDADGNTGNGLEERLYAQQDANFNVTALINTSGTVVERYVYDPYGAVTFLTAAWGTLSASAYAAIYLHQGGRYEPATGLYNFRYRDYSPSLGRWVQVDPLGFGGGDVNLYRTVGNNPPGSTDPLGLAKPGIVYVVQRPAYWCSILPHAVIVIIYNDGEVETWSFAGQWFHNLDEDKIPNWWWMYVYSQGFPMWMPLPVTPEQILSVIARRREGDKARGYNLATNNCQTTAALAAGQAISESNLSQGLAAGQSVLSVGQAISALNLSPGFTAGQSILSNLVGLLPKLLFPISPTIR